MEIGDIRQIGPLFINHVKRTIAEGFYLSDLIKVDEHVCVGHVKNIRACVIISLKPCWF